MKIKINNYTFDKTAKTVTFTDYVTIRLDAILTVLNTTSNAFIYNPAVAGLGGTVATNVLTFAFDSSAMSDTDKLLIYYDDAVDSNTLLGSLTETAPTTDIASSGLNGRLQRIAQRLTSLLLVFNPASLSTSTAYEAGRVAAASAATFLGISGYNSSTSGQFIQIHNASSAPADTAVPVEVIYVPAGSSFSFQSMDLAGDAYSTGIYVCCSSTGPIKTIGSATCWFNVRYR